jgi:DNA-binding transcriptional LysR family regulator
VGSAWNGIQARHLVALDAVVSTGSFNRAARRLGYTQSAISHQIGALESIVGELLVTRPCARTHRVAPTDAGEVVLAEARAILCGLRAAEARVRAVQEGHAGTVRIALPPGFAARLLPTLAPLGSVTVVETDDCAELLADGSVDLAVGEEAGADACEAEPLLQDELLALGTGELAGSLAVLLTCRATRRLLAELESPQVVLTSDQASTLVEFARNGGTAILPASRLAPNTGLAARPLGFARELALLWPAARPPVGLTSAAADVCRTELACPALRRAG